MTNKGKRLKVFEVIKKQEFVTAIIFLLMISVVATLQGNFFTLSALQNTAISWTPLILLSLGQSFVMLGGGLDLSSGNAMALMLCTMAAIMQSDNPYSGLWALCAGMALCVVIGLINGLSVAYFKIPPLIATFATSYIYIGAALFIMPTPGGSCANWMRVFYKFSSVEGIGEPLYSIGELFPSGIIMIVVICLVWAVMRRTRTGRYLYAIGSNRVTAYENGINTVKIQVLSYSLNSICCLLAALFFVGQNQSGSARIGEALTLRCIAAAIVGGIAGGHGNVYFSILGAAIISLVSKLISFSGLDSKYQTLTGGCILLFAIAGSALFQFIRNKTEA